MPKLEPKAPSAAAARPGQPGCCGDQWRPFGILGFGALGLKVQMGLGIRSLGVQGSGFRGLGFRVSGTQVFRLTGRSGQGCFMVLGGLL